MNNDYGQTLTALRVDGGMTANNLLMQCLSDGLDVPVVRPIVAETVSLGAAYAAGLAVGFWPDLDSLRSNCHMAAEWRPSMDRGRSRAGLPEVAQDGGPHHGLAGRRE
jgi:glycerol kinase